MKGKRHHHDGKHHKHAMHRATGGANEAEQDLKSKPMRYNESRVENEAEERKRGGRAKKHVGKVEGEHEKHRLDRKPRKNGGRTGADKSPFSSARHGTTPPGRKEMEENC